LINGLYFTLCDRLLAAPELPDKPEKPEKKGVATFEVLQSDTGDYYWKLRAANSQVLAVASEGYKKRSLCLDAIANIKRDVPSAVIQEQEVTRQPKESKDAKETKDNPNPTSKSD
jgi:uncharacterized protein YegP (UPF0339 family)